MLSALDVTNFTVFRQANFKFGGLNMVHGENGAGKTHVLKLAYSAWTCLHPGRTSGAAERPTQDWGSFPGRVEIRRGSSSGPAG